MRVAIITDTHYGARKGSKLLHDYFELFYKNVFFPSLEAEGIDTKGSGMLGGKHYAIGGRVGLNYGGLASMLGREYFKEGGKARIGFFKGARRMHLQVEDLCLLEQVLVEDQEVEEDLQEVEQHLKEVEEMSIQLLSIVIKDLQHEAVFKTNVKRILEKNRWLIFLPDNKQKKIIPVKVL